MKFTLPHPQDRLATILTQAKSMVKQLPLNEMQKQWDTFVENVTKKMNDSLQDQIEMLTLQLKDQEEALQIVKNDNSVLYLRNKEFEARLEARHIDSTRWMQLEDQNNRREKEIIDLKAELKTQVQNRDHFRALVAQQDAFIKEIKKQVEAYKADKERGYNATKQELETKTKEAEHLAKQAIRTTEENNNLRIGVSELTEEVAKFKEQTTRLIEEKRKLTDELYGMECIGCKTGEMGAYCGGCLGCLLRQAEHAMHLTENELNKVKSDTKTQLELYRKMTEHQSIAIQVAYPLVVKAAKKWFADERTRNTLGIFESNKCESESYAEKISKFGDKPKVAPTPANPEVLVAKLHNGPTHACCGDVNNVI